MTSDCLCRDGGAMQSFRTPAAGWWCSLCVREFPQNERFHGCRKCDYDTCSTCVLKKKRKHLQSLKKRLKKYRKTHRKLHRKLPPGQALEPLAGLEEASQALEEASQHLKKRLKRRAGASPATVHKRRRASHAPASSRDVFQGMPTAMPAAMLRGMPPGMLSTPPPGMTGMPPAATSPQFMPPPFFTQAGAPADMVSLTSMPPCGMKGRGCYCPSCRQDMLQPFMPPLEWERNHMGPPLLQPCMPASVLGTEGQIQSDGTIAEAAPSVGAEIFGLFRQHGFEEVAARNLVVESGCHSLEDLCNFTADLADLTKIGLPSFQARKLLSFIRPGGQVHMQLALGGRINVGAGVTDRVAGPANGIPSHDGSSSAATPVETQNKMQAIEKQLKHQIILSKKCKKTFRKLIIGIEFAESHNIITKHEAGRLRAINNRANKAKHEDF